jgi:hypothetical protein
MAAAKGRRSTAKAKAKAEEDEKPSARIRFRFSDTRRQYEIDILDLTTEEQVEFEEFFGKPWDVLMMTGWITVSIKGKVFAAYLARRRKEPGFTYEEALQYNAKTVDPPAEDGDRPTSDSRSDGSRS